MIPRLKDQYRTQLIDELKKQLNIENTNAVPKLEKIVINMGLGIDGNDNKIIKSCEEDLSKITGQKPVITKFKKSIFLMK